jgi:transposase, IS30 family
MKKHNKMTAPERDQIAWWLAGGIPIREMARRLGRSPSSISEELKRNQADGVYGSIKAHQAAEARKRHSQQKYLLHHCPTLLGFVLEKLKLGWSPQQISGRLKKEINEGVRPKREYVNHESIYQFLYDPAQKDEKLWAYLPRSHRNEDAGWAEEADQSKSLTGFRSGTDQVRLATERSLVIGKETRLLGMATKPEFTLR